MADKLRALLQDPNTYPYVFMYGPDGKGGLWKSRNVPAKYSDCWLESLPIQPDNPVAYATTEKYVGSVTSYVQDKRVGLFFFSKPDKDNHFGTGTGKAQPLTSKIFTPSGYKLMGDIKVGDTVVDGTGHTTTVTGVFPQGVKPVYRITLQDRTSFEVSSEHLNSIYWYDRHNKCDVDEVVTTEELIRMLEATAKHAHPKKYRIRIPQIDCWDDADLPIDPYLMGVLLGDGGLTGATLKLTVSEPDIKQKVTHILSKIGYELRPHSAIDYSISRIDRKHTTQFTPDDINLWQLLKGYGLRCLSTEKHIPVDYLHASVSQRLQLLQGLIDTDGHIAIKGGAVEFSTSSPQLSEDFAYLVRSLGMRDTVVTRPSGYRVGGVYHECSMSFRHCLKVANGVPFYSSEKHTSRYKERQNPPLRVIKSVEYVGDKECQCIMVDSPVHTYITDNFTVTHNTTAAITILNHYLYERLRQHLKGELSITDNPVYFCKSTDLQTAFNSQFRGTPEMQKSASERYYAIKNRAKSVELLVFDDIATKASTEAFTEELYEIIDHRATEELATIYTSNMAMPEVASLLGDRIASRIEGSTVSVAFAGKDHRKRGL